MTVKRVCFFFLFVFRKQNLNFFYWNVSCSHVAHCTHSSCPVWVLTLLQPLTSITRKAATLPGYLFVQCSKVFTGAPPGIIGPSFLLSQSSQSIPPIVVAQRNDASLYSASLFSFLSEVSTVLAWRVKSLQWIKEQLFSARLRLRGNWDRGLDKRMWKGKHVVMTVPYSWVFGQ